MSDSILDRLDRDPGGARQYVATLVVAGGATNADVADALARKYHISAPTTRSVSQWKNNDSDLRDLIRQMEAAKRDVKPGDNLADLLPREVNPAAAVADLFTVAIHCRPFAELLKREGDRRAGDAGDNGGWGFDDPAPAATDDGAPDAVLAVLSAEHETAAEFEADCRARLAADPLPVPGP
jgi:hypothetical protein